MQLTKLINSSPFSRYVVKKLKQLPVLVDLAIMGKGRDLTTQERAVVHTKIKHFWNYEKKQIMHGKVLEIRKLSAEFGVPCSESTVKRIAGEMKLQEQVPRFSKMVLVLTLEQILLKSLKLAALETDGFPSY